jgi:peptidoglycan LD-endopeptidase CwlK
MGTSKWDGLHPTLVQKLRRVLDAMNMLGFQMILTDGVRTTAEQQALFAKGRTATGRIVTHADGITKKSNHQVKGDGYGHAADCAFIDEKGKASWDEKYPWPAYGACAEAVGLVWGGKFSTIVDKPHVELLPNGSTT